MTSQKQLINTDPQRRCYNGCHYSSELIDTPYVELESKETKEEAEHRLKFWVDLNDYAVSQRGESAKRKFKIVEKPNAGNMT